MNHGIGHVARQLLDLPNGLNFRKIALACVYEHDLQAMTDLVSRCSGTIESLNVTDCLPCAYPPVAVLGQSLTARISLLRNSFV